MDKIRFRLAGADDAEKLLEVYAPYVENTNISFECEVPTVEEFKQRIEKISAKFPYIVALINDEIVGYAYASTFNVLRRKSRLSLSRWSRATYAPLTNKPPRIRVNSRNALHNAGENVG